MDRRLMRLGELPIATRLLADCLDGNEAAVRLVHPRRVGEPLPQAAAEKRSRPAASPALTTALRRQHRRFDAAPKALSALDTLERPDCSVVVTAAPAVPGGGCLSTLAKCLVAVRTARDLEAGGAPAVAVCLVVPADPEAVGRFSEIAGLAAEEPVQGWLAALSDTLAPGQSLTMSCAKFLSRLMGESGLVCIDPLEQETHAALPGADGALDGVDECRRATVVALREAGYGPEAALLQNQSGAERARIRLRVSEALSVTVWVADSQDAAEAAFLSAAWRAGGRPAPVILPFAGTTLVDRRSRKAMDRYGIDVPDLFRGSARLSEELQFEAALKSCNEKLGGLSELVAAEVGKGISAHEGNARSAARLADSRRRIGYQLAKIQSRLGRAGEMRREAARRHIGRLCDNLAPDGRLQAEVMPIASCLSRYSESLLPELAAGLDPLEFRHHLFFME